MRTLPLVVLLAAAPALAAEPANPYAGDAAAAATFTVRIENVSTGDTLRSASGATAPAPHSPGAWAVHARKGALFTAGQEAGGRGLEAQAEDGNPAALAASLRASKDVAAFGTFSVPLGDGAPGPALPGKAFEFTFEASAGQRLSFATMFGQSNDLFFAPDDEGLALFEQGRPVGGDVTAKVRLWDAGTERNEEPGFGPSQAPRQPAPDSGAAESLPVRPVEAVKDGFAYPRVADVIRVTITARGAGAVTAR